MVVRPQTNRASTMEIGDNDCSDRFIFSHVIGAAKIAGDNQSIDFSRV